MDTAAHELQQAVGVAAALSHELTALRHREAQVERALARMEEDIADGVAGLKSAALGRLMVNLNQAILAVEEVGTSTPHCVDRKAGTGRALGPLLACWHAAPTARL